MKKIILFTMALVLMLSVVAYAEDALQQPEYGVTPPITKAPEERLVPGELNITINGKVIYFAHKTYAENERTYVHGEKLFSELGYYTNYDKASEVLVVEIAGDIWEFRSAEGGGQIRDNVMYIPVRAVMEALGYTVEWDSANYAVRIEGGYNG